jgi:arylsulfatase A-like enzyme
VNPLSLSQGCSVFRLALQTYVLRAVSGAVMALAVLTGTSPIKERPVHSQPNIVMIVADDLGFSDLGCYGSEVNTPELDRLAANGLRFRQFYNCARCCPSRASILTGLYPHEAGVGHMLEDWHPPGYTHGLNEECATIGELLRAGGYRTYHVGKWHVGGVGQKDPRNHPVNRGFDHAHGTGGGGNYFNLHPLYDDLKPVQPGPGFYATDAFADWGIEMIRRHQRESAGRPFFLHLCFTAPHFPLQAHPPDIARHRGQYKIGWDELRKHRFERQKALGLVDPHWNLSPRDPIARAWDDTPEIDRDEWDLRMSVYAGMIGCLDRNIARVLEELRQAGLIENTVVIFFSDNGASAEALDSYPDPTRGHKPGSITGSAESHRCLEVAWANAANTPFREHKMWVHEGGISTPLIIAWPGRIKNPGSWTSQVGHVTDLMPTCLELAHAEYPKAFQGRKLKPLEGKSLLPVLEGGTLGPRTLAWEHEGNRAIREGDLKLVAQFRQPWQLYDLKADRTETHNLAAERPDDVRRLKERWQKWADRVGVVDNETLPDAKYRPTRQYRKKSEPVPDPY